MDRAELKMLVSKAVDRDERFASQLGEAVEKGTWEVVAALIGRTLGVVIHLTSDIMDLLKRSF